MRSLNEKVKGWEGVRVEWKWYGGGKKKLTKEKRGDRKEEEEGKSMMKTEGVMWKEMREMKRSVRKRQKQVKVEQEKEEKLKL